MTQLLVGLFMIIFLALPPVAKIMESVMIIHMHMQMPMLIIAGFLIAKVIQSKFPGFFDKWNRNGLPGIMLFIIIVSFWTLPRTMDEALNEQSMEIFKFISLPLLAGIPLRDSWKRLEKLGRNVVIILFTILFFAMGWLYVDAPVQLCNNYLIIDQIILGWGFLTTAICFVIYLGYVFFVDPSKYE
ncbi:hypothetical protein [Neobacillus mesonae]|uniref:hypothetical protein n=1 Tax=Neobacillus mesonae TaxID=1193713 RepID=UPI00257309C9|nr:hypothetical protein [Neobacillus mesonae]MED4202513.1 hypothetical protein [Neobacillus mesonae]